MPAAVAAVDLGATSGRVIIGRIDRGLVGLTTVHRFPNTPVETVDGLHWNILELYRNVVYGLRLALTEEPAISSIGVDSWAVDYALLHGDRMISVPYHYRDSRAERGVARVHGAITPEALYERNGLQFLPFNTVYQLAAEEPLMLQADAMLLIPDLITYWLTGQQICEFTNASTTGLLDVRTREWDLALMEMVGLPSRILRPLTEPGTVVGALTAEVSQSIGNRDGVVVTTVGSHDTASAVVGVPMGNGSNAAYISCGTWGLVGVELEHPVVTTRSRESNFTNEGGVDATIRFLHNVMGLWLVNESIREWERTGRATALAALLAEAEALRTPVSIFDANDTRFLAPGDIPSRIRDYCIEHGTRPPEGPVEVVRSILESLAVAFAKAVDSAADLSGRRIEVIHLVGGGAQNALLCQLLADRSTLPVVAGPVEATALGNVLVQARAQGEISGTLEALRSYRDPAQRLRRFEPRSVA